MADLPGRGLGGLTGKRVGMEAEQGGVSSCAVARVLQNRVILQVSFHLLV